MLSLPRSLFSFAHVLGGLAAVLRICIACSASSQVLGEAQVQMWPGCPSRFLGAACVAVVSA